MLIFQREVLTQFHKFPKAFKNYDFISLLLELYARILASGT